MATWSSSGPSRIYATGAGGGGGNAISVFPPGGGGGGIPHDGEYGMRPKGGGNRMPVQASVKGKDGWFSCSLHRVHYRESEPGCPMCDQAKHEDGLKRQIKELKNAIKLLQRDKDNLKAQVSHVDAMRLALEVMDDDDRLAIKEFLYRWQRGEKVDLVIRKEDFTSINGAGVRHMVAGFRVSGDTHVCRSVGGVAMARAFNDATKLVGRDEATALVAKVLSLAPPPEGDES